MNAQQSYMMDLQSRYAKHLQRQPDEVVTPQRRKHHKHKDTTEKDQLAMDKYVQTKFRIYNVIIDSEHRDKNTYPASNEFVVKLQETIKDVAAVRILKTEFYQPSNSFGYFVLNEMKVPLQLYNVEHAYLYFNGYISTTVANDTNVALFGRIGPGTDIYPAVTGDITKDPYIYIMRPVEPKLRKFHIKLLTHDGNPYPVNNARVVLTVAVYSLT
jgi:hypothetical protein